jgi:hypothetical protein
MANQKIAEIAQEERNNDRHVFARQQLDLLTPIVLAKLFKLPMSNSSLGTTAFKRLLQQLTPEQMHAMLAPLQPAQAAVIAELFKEPNASPAPAAQSSAAPQPAPAESPPGAPLAELLAQLDPEKVAQFLREYFTWNEQHKREDQTNAPPEPSS